MANGRNNMMKRLKTVIKNRNCEHLILDILVVHIFTMFYLQKYKLIISAVFENSLFYIQDIRKKRTSLHKFVKKASRKNWLSYNLFKAIIPQCYHALCQQLALILKFVIFAVKQ